MRCPGARAVSAVAPCLSAFTQSGKAVRPRRHTEREASDTSHAATTTLPQETTHDGYCTRTTRTSRSWHIVHSVRRLMASSSSREDADRGLTCLSVPDGVLGRCIGVAYIFDLVVHFAQRRFVCFRTARVKTRLERGYGLVTRLTTADDYHSNFPLNQSTSTSVSCGYRSSTSSLVLLDGGHAFEKGSVQSSTASH